MPQGKHPHQEQVWSAAGVQKVFEIYLGEGNTDSQKHEIRENINFVCLR